MTARQLIVGFGAVITVASLGLSACGGSGGNSAPIPLQPLGNHAHRTSGSTPIQHIVLLIQENRSFNNLFATFPGAVGATTGYELVTPSPSGSPTEQPIALTATDLYSKPNPSHLYLAFLTAYQNGAMDGFNLIPYQNSTQPEGVLPYEYVDPSKIKPYWDIAKQWGLADEMFQTQGSDSFTAHQDLIRGGTCISAPAICANPTASPEAVSLIDPPTSPQVWGCDSGPKAKTTLITASLVYEKGQGPFPCTNKFPDYGSNGYETLRDLLDAKSLAWKYYTPKYVPGPSALWSAFDMIAVVRYGSEWTTNVVSPPTKIYSDISGGTLPAMSWVIPDAQNSDHPSYTTKDTGPSWVASIVNAVGKSQYWDSTVVIVVWDDWGGFYDPVAPPTPRDWQGGPGLRVPMLVISPYVIAGTGKKGGYISNTVYGFGSIIRYIEDTFDLGQLGTTDETSTSIANMLDYTQTPRPFTKIPATYDQHYFLRQKPSGLPVDTE